jgi:hypothetical protein
MEQRWSNSVDTGPNIAPGGVRSFFYEVCTFEQTVNIAYDILCALYEQEPPHVCNLDLQFMTKG